ncbi:hypothetical protein [Pseudorhodoplanes sinuspersici]|uniref:Glycosyl transferase family 1 domain-containing protein n=1 Tax=Pseudorhodoplanes sinuspersici TaxID=1235591 RepID=A0A1W6ZTK0_9HYPH|nr:hypothetical protein [Pseudorhodoplanes sinuspersici]ARQ00714.1 hypothetical protein CAK95_17705 [Pseudorhodoplanes sinuspersici]
MKAISIGFLPSTIDDNNYANLSTEEEAAKRIYREFLRKTLRHLLMLSRIDVIISGNFAYFAERELHGASEEIDVPFIILHKENLKSAARLSYYEDHYRRRRGPFSGRRIIVYNSFEREVQIAAGIASADRISICGMPRLDRAHAWRRSEARKPLPHKPLVLFFTFGAKTGLPVLRRKFGNGEMTEALPAFDKLSWQKTAQLTIEAMLRFARENQHVTVILKSKRAAGHLTSFHQIAEGEVPANIRFVEGGDPLELLKEAWVVVGMNSTALLEALAMGKIVLSPGFAEAADPAMSPWIADFGRAVELARTPDALVTRLSDITNGPPPFVLPELDPHSIDCLDRWAGNADGKASERVSAIIQQEVSASEARNTAAVA